MNKEKQDIIKSKFKLHHETIGDAYYDFYCNPKYITNETLLKDIAKILNGELSAEDFREEIREWLSERPNCYLSNGEIKIEGYELENEL